MIFLFCVIMLSLNFSTAFAQDYADSQGAYQNPPIVHVGDRAYLVLPLPGNTAREDTVIIPRTIASGPVEIYRVALERRPSGSRLTVEFSAFETGTIELPPLEIGGMVFSGLSVEISSILEKSETGYVLSGPALPMLIPGTTFLIYGTIFGIITALLITFWILFKGRRYIAEWISAWKRRRLFISMLKIEKRLRKNLAGGAACRDILDTVSSEFRSFITWFTGVNCRSMTAVEFYHFSFPENAEKKIPWPVSNIFLGDFFYRCDSIRFSGRDIGQNETTSVLDALSGFMADLENCMIKRDR